MPLRFLLGSACLVALSWIAARAQETLPPANEPLFSGPQVGEPLPGFVVRGVFGNRAGQETDYVAAANGEPIVLIFVHDVNRQSVSMTRVLSEYTTSRAADKLHTGVVWLRDDATEAEEELHRIRHALASEAPVGISVDGGEGPGSYGLNRRVTLTVIIGNAGTVTANYALIQPSLQVDLPKILDSIIALVGGAKPDLAQLAGMPKMRAAGSSDDTPNLRPLLQPLISKTASVSEVDQAAVAIEKRIREDQAARQELGRIATTIVRSGKLSQYGTAPAQKYLQKWASEIGPPPAESLPSQERE